MMTKVDIDNKLITQVQHKFPKLKYLNHKDTVTMALRTLLEHKKETTN